MVRPVNWRISPLDSFHSNTRQEIALGKDLKFVSSAISCLELLFQVLAKMRNIIGYTGGESIFAPGGSICNMYALLVARHKVAWIKWMWKVFL